MKRITDKKKFVLIIIPLVVVLLLILVSKYFTGRYLRKASDVTTYISDEKEDVGVVYDRNLQGELPDDFPSKLPIYEGAVIDESWETKTDDTYAISVVSRAKEKPSQVFHFYEENLLLAGYEISVLSDDGNSYTITYSKEDESGFIGITKDGQETLISVTIGNNSN